jgi:hypothetical protein
MQGIYIKMRTWSFSEMLFSFLDILKEPQFFRELQNFCSNDFDSQKDFEEKFLHFGQIMKNSPPECIFSKFFYPRVFEVCKYCKAKICYSEYFKTIRICEDCCDKYHRELLLFDDIDYDLDSDRYSDPDSD